MGAKCCLCSNQTGQEMITLNTINNYLDIDNNKIDHEGLKFKCSNKLQNKIIVIQSLWKSYVFRKKFVCKEALADNIKKKNLFISKLRNQVNYDLICSIKVKESDWKLILDKNNDYSKDMLSKIINDNYLDVKFTEKNEEILKNNIKIYKNGDIYIGYTDYKFTPIIYGEFFFINGSYYNGEIDNNGNISGYGMLYSSNKTIILGKFDLNILIQGYGIKYKNNNTTSKIKSIERFDIFRGYFENGKRKGMGIEDTSELFYEGNFDNNKKDGYGRIKYLKTKDFYEGSFKNGNIYGYGTYIWGNGNKYIGDFVNGKMHGNGKYYWPDGSVYEGEYKLNIKSGKGKFKWPNNKEFIGEFVNGKPHGKGFLGINGGEYHKSEFVDGKLLETSLIQ